MSRWTNLPVVHAEGPGSNPFRDASRALPHNLIVAKLLNYVRLELDIAARAMATSGSKCQAAT